LAAQLGLESVEELENAIDKLEGIAPDGGSLEDENLPREARVRSAYLDWCKEFGKEGDESRFSQFMSNYLEMEDFSKDSGKEMTLNAYADFTEEEYVAMTSGADGKKAAEKPAPKAKTVVPEADTKAADAKAEQKAAAAAKADAKAAAAKAEQEAAATAKADAKAAAAKAAQEVKAVQEAAAAAKVEEAAAAKAVIAAAQDKKKKEADDKAKKFAAEKAKFANMSDEDRRKEIEKDKSARQSAQDKTSEKERLSTEAAAIAAVSIDTYVPTQSAPSFGSQKAKMLRSF
jgi:hypothetical protein